MKKVAVFTSSRAEYDILFWLLKDIDQEAGLDLKLIVSGSHLSPAHGFSLKKIEQDGFEVHALVEMLVSSDTPVGSAKSLGLQFISLADAIRDMEPDFLLIVGDRFEALGAATVANLFNIPVVHFHGGEETLGANDDAFRHAITKLSSWHFVTNEIHRNRVVQMGEQPNSVFNYGALGIDRRKFEKLESLQSLSDHLKFCLTDKFFLITLHPVTRQEDEVDDFLDQVFAAIDEVKGYKLLFTQPNHDAGGVKIMNKITQFSDRYPQKAVCVSTLGNPWYFSAMKLTSAVVGNSSSGIIEAPSFRVPTVNIGDRQLGREAALSVINCMPKKEDIIDALNLAVSKSFKKRLDRLVNPYGDGLTSGRVIETLKSIQVQSLTPFHDLVS